MIKFKNNAESELFKDRLIVLPIDSHEPHLKLKLEAVNLKIITLAEAPMPQLTCRKEEMNLMRDILEKARSIQGLPVMAKLKTVSQLPSAKPIQSNLTFPPCQPISHRFTEIGIPPHLANQISSSYLSSASALRQKCEFHFQATCDALSSRLSGHALQSMISCTHRAYLTMYMDSLTTWATTQVDQAAYHVKINNSKRHSPSKLPRSTFNQEYTPLLEKYFEYNAYPSAPDRLVLARKSMMTSRQIEVWFQNHRTRAKKEGRHLRKLSCDPLPVELSMKCLELEMPFFVIPENERTPVTELLNDNFSDDDSLLVDSPTTSYSSDSFISRAPTHAFPTVYPPNVGYDPFPCKGGIVKFPPPQWARTPAKSSVSTESPNLDDLVADFSAKLHLRDGPSKQRKCRLGTSSRKPWFSSTISALIPAPHPAFVRSVTAPSTTLSLTTLHPHITECSNSYQSKHRPPRLPTPVRERREAQRLHKRGPRLHDDVHRDASFPLPTPSRSSSSSSRSSSSSSLPSLDDRSISPCSSIPSPNILMTPLPSPTLSPPTCLPPTVDCFTQNRHDISDVNDHFVNFTTNQSLQAFVLNQIFL